ncbi:MAG: hypothetical protein KDD41_11525 [Flavobacteriales bacterium]|nr:hypothetical protein [Flavobacteriales bacterium]
MKFITLLTTLFCISSLMHAQEPILRPGGGALGAGSSPYSIDHALNASDQRSNSTLTDDSQQTYEILVVTGMEKTTIKLSMATYPAPNSGILYLTIAQPVSDQFSYQLVHDTELIEEQPIATATTAINIQELPEANYLLRVLKKETVQKTFQINKN